MESPGRARIGRVVMAVAVIGTVLAVVAAITSAQHNKDTRLDWLEDRADLVSLEVREAVERSVDGLSAVAVFLEVSGSTSQSVFDAFVAGLDPELSLIGAAYMPIVEAEDIDEFVAEIRRSSPDFAISEILPDGTVMPASLDRDIYYPVLYFRSGSLLNQALADRDDNPTVLSQGIDARSQPPWRPALDIAIAEDMPTVSEFIEVGFGETFIGKAYIVAVPVHEANGDVVGLVAAPMIDTLLPAELDASLARDITWQLGSVESQRLVHSPSVFVADIELPAMTWSVTVEPTPGASRRLAGTSPWLVGATGLALAAALALFTQLLVARAASRRRLNELDRLSTDKDRFLASVSHEIRTPLTIVMGVANELRDRPQDFDYAETRDLLELMVEQSDEVAAIVDDLLIAARADFDGVAVTPTRVRLFEQAEHLLESGVVTADLVGSETAAIADAARVRQILRNLLTNAGRYGGPNIEVRVGTDDGWATLSVADDGPPIASEHRDTIFQPYTSTGTTDPSLASLGMGLGLFVSTELATILNGTLTYTHDGRYSIFCLKLPAAEPDQQAATAMDLVGNDAAAKELVYRSEETTF
ncbi:MAG: ATP-binding protein [Acidimicrobiia bacterium]|nr:ATP-binding protein [Acidimicrobiia bacterium]